MGREHRVKLSSESTKCTRSLDTDILRASDKTVPILHSVPRKCSLYSVSVIGAEPICGVTCSANVGVVFVMLRAEMRQVLGQT